MTFPAPYLPPPRYSMRALPRRNAVRREGGFTLIELSIVLVIIGLLVGAVFVGQDMIKSSELRATVSQVEKFRTAVNTFQVKYGYLPGDIPQATAGAFGLFQLSSPPPANGDGNGFIEVGHGEDLVFWRHLTDANLIEGSYGTIGGCAINPINGLYTGSCIPIANALPQARIHNNMYFMARKPMSGFENSFDFQKNYFLLYALLDTGNGYLNSGNFAALTPIEAQMIDTKMDDGMPNAGRVLGRYPIKWDMPPGASPISTSTKCAIGSMIATDTYNTVPATGGNDRSCAMAFEF